MYGVVLRVGYATQQVVRRLRRGCTKINIGQYSTYRGKNKDTRATPLRKRQNSPHLESHSLQI